MKSEPSGNGARGNMELLRSMLLQRRFEERTAEAYLRRIGMAVLDRNWRCRQGEVDLVALDADPLANIGNVSRIAGVMVSGRWLPKSEIDARLERIAAVYATPAN